MEKMKESINKDLEELKNKHTETNNTITEIKNTLEGINNRISEAKEQISELEDKMVEITSEEQNKIKRMKRTEDSPRHLWDNIKCTIWIIGVPEEEEKKKGSEKIFEEIIVENFPFWYFKCILPFPLAWRVSVERSAVKCIGFPLYFPCCFSVGSFNILSLCLVFVSLINMCLGMFFLRFIQYGTLCASWTWLFPFSCWGNFQL